MFKKICCIRTCEIEDSDKIFRTYINISDANIELVKVYNGRGSILKIFCKSLK